MMITVSLYFIDRIGRSSLLLDLLPDIHGIAPIGVIDHDIVVDENDPYGFHDLVAANT